MPVTTTPVADQSGDAPAARPSRKQAAAEALKRISADYRAPAPEPATATTPASTPAAVAPNGAPAVPAKPAATAQGEPAKPTAKPDDMQAAIELERSKRELVTMRAEAQAATRELATERERAAARAKDPMQALKDAGHNIEEVVMQWVGGDAPAKSGGTPAAADGGTATEQALRAELAALRGEFTQLRDGLHGAGQRYTREQRLNGLRQQLTGDDFEATSALDAHDQVLTALEKIEQERGGPLGDVEMRAELQAFEERTRTTIAAQIKKLGGGKWAKQVMRDILQELGDPAPAAAVDAEPVPMRVDLMNADAGGASRSRPMSREELKATARAKAMAAMAARGKGGV